jgi:molybdopterin-guanine dinucleotide biosynthesis protein A
VVVAKDGSPLPPLDCRLIVEPTLPAHPLCGIAAALSELGEEAIVVCACDMPFLSGELLAWLATRSEPLAIAAPGGRAQPLLGRYAAQLLDGLEAALAEELPMREAARRLGAVEIADTELGRFGDPQRLCANINTPAELAAAGG